MKIEYMLYLNHNTLECVVMGYEHTETIVDCLIEYQAKDDIVYDSFIDSTNVNGAQWQYLENNCSTAIEIEKG